MSNPETTVKSEPNNGDTVEPIYETGGDMLTAIMTIMTDIASAAMDSHYVFRGEPKCYSEISSSLYREYKTLLEDVGTEGFDIRNVQEEIIEEAGKYAPELTREDLISQLQHYGHPTNLIDFTTDYLIALYFACSTEPARDGRIILLDTVNAELFRLRTPANRIKAQKSIFVSPPSGIVTPDKNVCVPSGLKYAILEYLRIYHAISTNTIYDDIHGFIRNSAANRSAYAEFHMGGIFLQTGDLEKALEHYNRSIELNGNQLASLGGRGTTYLRLGRFQEAIGDFTRIIELEPEDPRAFAERGRAYFGSGQPQFAEADFDEAIRLDDRLENAFKLRAACRLLRGETEGALKDAEFVIELNPNDGTSYYTRGNVYAAIGDHHSALSDFATAIKLDPKNPMAFFARSLVQFDIDAYRSAIDDLDNYLRLGGENECEALFRRGIAQVLLANFDESRADFSKALDIDPSVANRVIKGISIDADENGRVLLDDSVPDDIVAILEMADNK